MQHTYMLKFLNFTYVLTWLEQNFPKYKYTRHRDKKNVRNNETSENLRHKIKAANSLNGQMASVIYAYDCDTTIND